MQILGGTTKLCGLWTLTRTPLPPAKNAFQFSRALQRFVKYQIVPKSKFDRIPWKNNFIRNYILYSTLTSM